MRPAGTDAIGMLRWGLRRYRLLFLVCVLIGLVVTPVAALLRTPPVEAETLVVAERLDMDLAALPRYGQAVFNNGQVTAAVASKLAADASDIIPGRAQVFTEQDSIIFRVVGRDQEATTAAQVANTAAEAFVEALNEPGAGVGTFAVQSPATPPAADASGPSLLVTIPVGLAAGLVLGLAAISVLLVARRPIISGADAEEATGVPALGTVSIPRSRSGGFLGAEHLAGLAPVCRRLLALPTSIVVLVSRPAQAPLRRQLSVAITNVLGRARDMRFVGPTDLQQALVRPSTATTGSGGSPALPGLTVVDSNEPLDLVQPPESTATVLVVPEGISSSALRSAVVEHLGGSAESRLVLVRPGRRALVGGATGPQQKAGRAAADQHTALADVS